MTPSALTIQEQHMIRPTGSTAFAMRVIELEAENAEYRALLRELLVQLCENPGTREDGNAPGHAHDVPGVWDSDNGELAGKPCAWCAVWARAVANGLVGSNVELTGSRAGLSPVSPATEGSEVERRVSRQRGCK